MMALKVLRMAVLGLGSALVLTACGGSGPSDSEIAQALKGTTHMMIGRGFAHSGFLKTEQVSDIERGDPTTIGNTEVFPIRAKLSGGGKEGEFTYLFYKNEFGEWTAEEKS